MELKESAKHAKNICIKSYMINLFNMKLMQNSPF